MKGYLDTCLISAIVKSDLKEVEQLALAKIHEKYIANEIELFASEHVEEELNKIPSKYRQEHLDVFELFNSAPKLKIGGLTHFGPGGPIANPKRRKMNSLLSLLSDKDDAWHLFIASSNRISCFVTADVSTVIKYKDEIKYICGVEVLLPSEFLDYCNKETT